MEITKHHLPAIRKLAAKALGRAPGMSYVPRWIVFIAAPCGSGNCDATWAAGTWELGDGVWLVRPSILLFVDRLGVHTGQWVGDGPPELQGPHSEDNTKEIMTVAVNVYLELLKYRV